MSDIIGVAGKRISGARIHMVRCAHCARVYESTDIRSRIERARHCKVCMPYEEAVARAAHAGAAHRFNGDTGSEAGRRSGEARRKRATSTQRAARPIDTSYRELLELLKKDG